MQTSIYSDDFFMKQALQEAKKALEKGEVPVGCVVVLDNQIIARGHNLTETLNDVTAHAEMQTITSSANYLNSKFLDQCTMYVTLEPCQMCAGALYWSRLKKLVFGARDEQRGFIKMRTQLHPKTEIIEGILQNECSQTLVDFFKSKRN